MPDTKLETKLKFRQKMQQEKYSLTWHTYSDYLRGMMQEMMTSEAFADVTLVSDDKRTVKAHRSILSACSPVLKDILQMEASQHSVIYLRGIQYSEIESIMQFLYLGEARFYEDRVNEFVSVSKNLEIKGLSSGLVMNDQTGPNLNEQKVEFSNDFSVQVDTNKIHATVDREEVHKQTGNDSGSRKRSKIDASSKDPSFQCKECQRVFNSQPALMYHKKSRHEGVKYTCDQCDYQATAQHNLTQHIQSKHEGINKYACNQCDYQATRHSSLTIHIQSKHEGVKYACNHCDQKFISQLGLTLHIQSKHEGVEYACNQCDYKATERGSLRKHNQYKHEGVKYACNQCDYQATHQSNLTRHIQSIHEGVMYACNKCDKQFTQQNHLTTHIQYKHEGVKYGCNQCDYQAATQSSLTSHIQSKHEGVKYACNHCDHQATTKSSLTKHIQYKHEGAKYACNQCDYQGTKSNLTRHILSIHEVCGL